MGSKRVNVLQPGGVTKEFVITECKYVPKLWTNLFSVTCTLRLGWQLSNDGIIMSLTKQGETLVFDQVLHTTSGAITGVIMRPVTYPNLNVGVELKNLKSPVQDIVQEVVQKVIQEEAPEPAKEAVPLDAPILVPPTVVTPVIRWDKNDLHKLLGHAHFDAIKKSAKHYNIKLSGEPKICVSCALAKIRQKNINKVTLSKSITPGN
jgi:hypothetical protein